jgi:omega-3 fatty acid desaturase (delta-15 desaturase)
MAPPTRPSRAAASASGAAGASPDAAATKRRGGKAAAGAAPGAAAAAGGDPVLPTLDELRAAIPAHCFAPSPPLSLLYLGGYLGAFATAPLAYPAAAAAGPLALAAYAFFYGTVMWALFVIGHDAGHGTFSRYPLLNALVGHVAHAPLLVPYYPWALSHHHHHLYHNHVTKDFSHFWLTPEARKGMHALGEAFADSNVLLLLATPVNFALYLYPGLGDGTHVLPWGQLWEKTAAGPGDRARCVLSTAAVAAFAGALYAAGGLGWGYALPWLVFSSWLFAVTYMQHHRPGVQVFGDASWGFVRGGLETVDRVMGWGLDALTLHITSDHLVHHLFFRGIPHYHLREATAGVAGELARRGLSALHQRVVYASPLHYAAHFCGTVLSCGFSNFVLIE